MHLALGIPVLDRWINYPETDEFIFSQSLPRIQPYACVSFSAIKARSPSPNLESQLDPS